MSFSSFFSNLGSKTSDFLGFDGQFGIQGSTVSNGIEDFGRVKTASIPKPTPSPVSAGSSASSGFSLGSIGDFLKSTGEAAKTGFQTFFNIKSQFNQAKVAQELEEIKLDAVRKSAQQAPAAAQVLLPTFSDFLNDPREAASRVTPAAIAGSGIGQGASNILLYGLIAGAIYYAVKK